MEKIYIFGHKKPDTDSVVSAISLSYLKNKLGYNTQPYVLGTINNESKYVLNYFKVKEPEFLHDTKIQIKNVNYSKDLFIYSKSSIFDAYNYISSNNIGTVPVTDKNNNLLGALSTKDITKYLFINQKDTLNTTIRNIATVIDGVYNCENKLICGILTLNNTSNNDHILVMNRETDINEHTKLIIACNMDKKILKKYKLPIITTNKDLVNVVKTIFLSNIVTDIMNKKIISINENIELNDFINIAKKTKRTNYPVVNDENKCLGIISSTDINDVNKKKVILVDHNEFEQSVDGIEENTILEIIDHHRIGLQGTNEPINFKNVPVGSTSTIIYTLYKENKIKLPKNISGLLLSGIISDTLLFRSPTTTDLDKKVAKSLARSLKIDMEKYSKNMFKARSVIKTNLEEMFFEDYKTFNIENKIIGIAQITTTDSENILTKKNDFKKIIDNHQKSNELSVLALFITDIINNGSFLIFSDESKDILEKAFGMENLKQCQFFEAIMSRKKQIVPLIIKALEKK